MTLMSRSSSVIRLEREVENSLLDDRTLGSFFKSSRAVLKASVAVLRSFMLSLAFGDFMSTGYQGGNIYGMCPFYHTNLA